MFKTTSTIPTWKEAASTLRGRGPGDETGTNYVEEYINRIFNLSLASETKEFGDYVAVAPNGAGVDGFIGVFLADEDGAERKDADLAKSIEFSLAFLAQNIVVPIDQLTGTGIVSIAFSVDYSWSGEHMTVLIPVNERGEIAGDVAIRRAWEVGWIGRETCTDATSIAKVIVDTYKRKYDHFAN